MVQRAAGGLEAELGRRRQESGCPASPGELRQEVEEKVRQVLAMLRSLNTMKISEEVLGRLVLEAVEEAYDPVAREVAVFRFLALLYQSTRDYERQVADCLLTTALESVGEDVMDASDSSSLGLSVPEGMSTLQPRKIQDTKDQEDMYQIHV